MEKHGTPESTGKCDACGQQGIVVPVESGSTKVASINNKDSSGYDMLCPDCSGVPIRE